MFSGGIEKQHRAAVGKLIHALLVNPSQGSFCNVCYDNNVEEQNHSFIYNAFHVIST